MILVDSSVWIDYFRGARNRPVEQLVAWLQGGDATVDLGVADLVVFEVMRGFAAPKEQKRAKDLLQCIGQDKQLLKSNAPSSDSVCNALPNVQKLLPWQSLTGLVGIIGG